VRRNKSWKSTKFQGRPPFLSSSKWPLQQHKSSKLPRLNHRAAAAANPERGQQQNDLHFGAHISAEYLPGKLFHI
jgi:hypothetical protein